MQRVMSENNQMMEVSIKLARLQISNLNPWRQKFSLSRDM